MTPGFGLTPGVLVRYDEPEILHDIAVTTSLSESCLGARRR
jgi:hypothetical protein